MAVLDLEFSFHRWIYSAEKDRVRLLARHLFVLFSLFFSFSHFSRDLSPLRSEISNTDFSSKFDDSPPRERHIAVSRLKIESTSTRFQDLSNRSAYYYPLFPPLIKFKLYTYPCVFFFFDCSLTRSPRSLSIRTTRYNFQIENYMKKESCREAWKFQYARWTC